MSSFLVANETIDRILSYKLQHNDISQEYLTKVGRKLLKMNCLALKYRYNDQLKPEEWNNYKFNPCFHMSDIQCVKSLDCLLYQSLEGKVPDMEFFKEWQETSYKWAKTILKSLKSYEAADWG